ncbi:MAG: phosphate signaling complex protein PhoU [Erysipelotrichaceae bacterium]|nr:phosphate signaling complex protein PhoU [Erysipelotrichaceae bacterium]
MRNKFDEQLATLNEELTNMGSMCERAIYHAAEALVTGSKHACELVEELDGEISHQERDIEALCLKLLLQQQPVARDLRQLSAALKMITDMERIGTQAGDIADIIPDLKGKSGEECKPIRGMAEAAIKMVTESVDAFVKRDIDLARETIKHDDIVDTYFNEVKSSLIKMIAQHPEEGEYALHLLMIAKYFERIGDHAVNIANWVLFSATGVRVEIQ